LSSTAWPYTFPLPLAACQKHGYGLKKGVHPDLVGVDGRCGGGIRRFPGFTTLRKLEEGEFSSAFSTAFLTEDAVSFSGFFKYAEIQKGTTGHLLRGFVASLENGAVRFYYYDTETSAWGARTLYSPGTVSNTEHLDVSYMGRYLYVALLGSVGLSCFHWKEDLQVFPFGFSAEPENLVVGAVNDTGSSGLLSGDTGQEMFWGIGVRFGDSRRNVWSPMAYYSYPPEGERLVGDGTSTYHLRLYLDIPAEAVDVYDTVEIYRTITSGGILYRDIYYYAPTQTGVENATLRNFIGGPGGTFTAFLGMRWDYTGLTGWDTTIHGTKRPYMRSGMADDQLVFMPAYDWELDEPGPVPTGNRIFGMGGSVLKTAAYSVAPSSEIHWSHGTKFQPENFPSLNTYRTGRASDRISRFIANGDFIFGLTSTRAYRFTKVSGSMAVERVAHGAGTLGYGAAAELPGAIALVSNAHLMLITPQASMNAVSILDQVLFDTDHEYQLAYDAVGECLFLVDVEGGLSYTLWGGTNTVSTLGQLNFEGVTSGAKPDLPLSQGLDGTADMAFFLTSTGLVLYADFKGEAATPATLGVTPATGTLSSFSGTTVTGTFDTTYGDGTLAHCYCYFLQPDGTITAAAVTTNTASTLSLAASYTFPAGTKYYIGALPFQWLGWPLWENNDVRDKETIYRRMGEGILFDIRSLRGSAAQNFLVSFYDREFTPLTGTARETTSVAVDFTRPDKNFGKARVSSPTLIPSLLCLEGGRTFELLQVTAMASIENTQQTGSSQS